MSIRKAQTTWHGNLREGNGNMTVESGAFDVPYTWSTRFADTPGTNPEELIGAAHAGCFTMSLSGKLTNAGFPPEQIHTEALVHFGKDEIGSLIQKIELNATVKAAGVSQAQLDELADLAKRTCPVSRALAAISEISVRATLK